jgi:alpha-L-fucosidase 2
MDRRQFLASMGMAGIATHLLKISANAHDVSIDKSAVEASSPLSLWYTKPASAWNEALPIGNGRIGAMVFGAVGSERIQFNEATLWTGRPHDYTNPNARESLQEIRSLIFAEDVEAADKLADRMMGIPSQLQAYQPFCDLHLDFYSDTHVDGYRRSLDLDTAIASVKYSAGGSEFQREAFVSYPDQVFVLHLSGSEAARQTLRISLSTPHSHSKVRAISGASLLFTGQLMAHTPPEGSWIAAWEGEGLQYAAQAQVVARGGAVRAEDEAIFIEGAVELTILVGLGTSFRTYTDVSADPIGNVQKQLDTAASRSFAELRERHVTDYQHLFRRVTLELGGETSSSLSTDRRILKSQSLQAPHFLALFYQFGRYLLISASRPGGQPANLQGIWNETLWPWWGGKWTANINLQMNYWLAETGGLPECVEPLYDLLDDLRVTGAEVARVHYGCKGFVFHHNADLWRSAAPVDGSWGLWPVGGAWLALQMWEHYAYSLDKEFLKHRSYPALKEAATFMLDFLIEIPQGKPLAGCLATNPTSSPENAFILPGGVKGRLTYATTMDIEILEELFQRCVEAAGILSIDEEFCSRIEAAKRKLPPRQIGANGELQEWIGDYTKTETEHRHLSHLFGVYPGSSLSVGRSPELWVAARRSLELRGDGEGPGSCFKAWRAAMWARFGDGERAHRILTSLVAHSTSPDMLNDSYDQVDGHLGGPAAIAEMLMQSHTGEVVLLPALPARWDRGHVRGLCARGGSTLELQWTRNSLDRVAITARGSGKIKLRYKSHKAEIDGKPDVRYEFDGELRMIPSSSP